MHYDLGYIELEQKTLQPLDNPFGARFTYLLGTLRYPCLGTVQLSWWRARQDLNPRPPGS